MEEGYQERLVRMASTIMNRPITLSPVLEHPDTLRYVRLPLTSPEVDFQIILNVGSFKLNEIFLTFPADDILQLRASHAEREIGGCQVVRDCVYNFTLPSGIHKDVLTALWTDDEFLIIQPRVPTPTSLNELPEETRLIPQRIGWILKNDLSVSILKTLLSSVEEELEETLDYIEESTDEDSVSETVVDPEMELQEKPETEEDLAIKEKPEAKEDLPITQKPEAKEDLAITPKPEAKEDLAITPKPEAKEDLAITQKPEAKEDLAITQKPEAKEDLAITQKPEAKKDLAINEKPEAKEKPAAKEDLETERKPETKPEPGPKEKPKTKQELEAKENRVTKFVLPVKIDFEMTIKSMPK